MKYQRIVLADGTILYRSQPRDPVTKRRLNIEASSLEQLKERLKRVAEVRQEMRWGSLQTQAAVERLKPVQQSGPYTVGALWERYLRTVSPRSLKIAKQNWTHRLRKWFATLAPHELTRDRMAAWERELQAAGFAPKTIASTYADISRCIRLDIDAGNLRELPWGGVSRHFGGSGWRPAKAVARRERQAVGSIEQLMALVYAAKAEDEVRWRAGLYSAYAASLTVFLLTGLRQAELCALGWDCVELDTEPRVMRVMFQAGRAWHKAKGAGERPKQPTKTGKSRSQVIHPTVVRVLQAHRAELQRRGWYRFDGPVFPGNNGGWRTSGRVIIPAKIKGWAKVAGLPFPEDWVVHSTRHSFSTLEVKASGGDLKRTQARTGHADVRQLEGYLHATGSLLGNTALPDIPLRLEPVKTLPSGAQYVDVDPWGFEHLPAPGPVEELSTELARRGDEADREKKRALREGSERKFTEIAAEWLARPERVSSGVPPEVTEAAKRAYCRAYSAAKREGLPVEARQAAARRKQRATLGAWGRALTLAQKALNTCQPDKNETSIDQGEDK